MTLRCIAVSEVPVLVERDAAARTEGALHRWAGFDTDEEWRAAIAAGQVCGMWITDKHEIGPWCTGLTVCLSMPGHHPDRETRLHIGYVQHQHGALYGYQWTSETEGPAPELPPLPATEAGCGGCRGEGAHRKWCPEAVGRTAAMFGRWAEQAENLADTVGSNDTTAANRLYVAAGSLRDRALAARAEHLERTTA